MSAHRRYGAVILLVLALVLVLALGQLARDAVAGMGEVREGLNMTTEDES